MLMYNFVSAFAACLVIILAGEILSNSQKDGSHRSLFRPC